MKYPKYPAMAIFSSLNNHELSKVFVRIGVVYCLIMDTLV